MACSSQLLFDYTPDTCMFCRQCLCIVTSTDTEFDAEHPGTATVIDDVELYCGPPESGPGGHHAHWTCLIDHAKQARAHGVVLPVPTVPATNGDAFMPTPSALTTCMVCGQNTLDLLGRFIVDVRNEGGETMGFDFGVILEEELFLDSHPNQVHNRAFHDLVADGDYAGAIELIAEHDIDVNCAYGSEGLTALQKAIFSGDVGGAEFLKSLGAAV